MNKPSQNSQTVGPKGEQSYWALVPAAGIGQRMGSDTPKQYLPLLDQTVLEHSVNKLLSIPVIEGVIVATRDDDQYWPALSLAQNSKVHRVSGGAERMDSVYAGLQYLRDDLSAGSDDFILVHDAVRPCVSVSDIKQLIADLEANAVGGLLAAAVVDTLKRVDSEGQVVETLDRDSCWRAQTPQMFRLNVLMDSLEAQMSQKKTASDEAAAVEALGLAVKIIEGSPQNLKLTVPGDLALVESILKDQLKA